MDQYEGCVEMENKYKVCKPVNSLYCLKETPKQWHDKFDTVFLSNGCRINEADKHIYTKFENNFSFWYAYMLRRNHWNTLYHVKIS